MDAAQGLFLMKAEKLVQRTRAFADLIRLLNRLGNVRLRQDHGFAELLSARELRQDRG